MNLLELALIALLATYRITFMLNSEAGPADIFGRFRTLVGVTYDEYSKPVGSNWFAEGVLCFMCLSVWIGIGATALLAIGLLVGHVLFVEFLLLPFALSGGAIFLKKWAG